MAKKKSRSDIRSRLLVLLVLAAVVIGFVAFLHSGASKQLSVICLTDFCLRVQGRA